ncbi:MAG: hypothetical protein AAFR45_00330 [Pseudomonadota bacterium]
MTGQRAAIPAMVGIRFHLMRTKLAKEIGSISEIGSDAKAGSLWVCVFRQVPGP